MNYATVNIDEAVALVREAFTVYYSAFLEITERARHRFAERDWSAVLSDAEERIGLYHLDLDLLETTLRDLLGESSTDLGFWDTVKPRYQEAFAGLYHADLALIFFYSVVRRLVLSLGKSVEYDDDEMRITRDEAAEKGIPRPYRTHIAPTLDATLLKRMLVQAGLDLPFEDLERDATWLARAVIEDVPEYPGTTCKIDVIKHPFYRNKAVYLIGRLHTPNGLRPLVIVLLNPAGRLRVDTVLTAESDVSNSFTSARSNFHVMPVGFRELFRFLRSILPTRTTPYIYSSIGFVHPAKLELVKQLRQHLRDTEEQFTVAPGIPGTVMGVFLLPQFQYVFKIIRDRSSKQSFRGKPQVIRQYWRVHRMDRVGRMLDMMTFHNLRFSVRTFEPALLEELLDEAATSVWLDGEDVVFQHLYAQRMVRPLNLYLADESIPEAARKRTAVDYGQAVKDLAAAGIFVGDYLTKNFGVTRYGRVILYDYDDIDDLVKWHFRAVPEAPPWAEMLPVEDWLSVGSHDVFPEEDFRRFLLPSVFKDEFLEEHEDLLTPGYWNGIRDELLAGRPPDFFPYRRDQRLKTRFG